MFFGNFFLGCHDKKEMTFLFKRAFESRTWVTKQLGSRGCPELSVRCSIKNASFRDWVSISIHPQGLVPGLGCSSVVEVRQNPTELRFGCQTERTDPPNFNNERSLFFFLTVTPAKNESKKNESK